MLTNSAAKSLSSLDSSRLQCLPKSRANAARLTRACVHTLLFSAPLLFLLWGALKKQRQNSMVAPCTPSWVVHPCPGHHGGPGKKHSFLLAPV